MDEVPVMYAVLYPPNFFAQAAALEKPELRKRAFAGECGDMIHISRHFHFGSHRCKSETLL